MFKKLNNDIKNYSLNKTIDLSLYLAKHASDKQMLNFIKLVEKFSSKGSSEKAIKDIRIDFEKKGPWYKIINKLFKEINPNCQAKFIKNFVLEDYIKSEKIREEYRQKYGENPPVHLVISPTMRCNLRCVGCYAGQYSKKEDLKRIYFEKAIEEAKNLGIKYITISGGEPFIRADILDIFKKNNDVFFHVYTNGTFIDQKMAKELAELGNVAPAISVEGFEKETNQRRGKDVWKKIMFAMDNLKKQGVIFGFSATPTRLNMDILTSEKFIDLMIKKGAMFGWFFHYIPIGKDPNLNLVPLPTQREKLRQTIQYNWRKNKPIFLGDFWNDGPYVGGCMAGGSMYLHINVKGDIEPCVFVQVSKDNIKNTSIKKALQSELFKFIRNNNQSIRAKNPTSENLFAPCMIIDNPEVLRKCIKCCKHKFSYPGGDHLVKNKKTIKFLDQYSKNWHKITDKIWKKEYGHKYWIERKKDFKIKK